MNTHYTAVISVITLAAGTMCQASDSEFSARMAAWQRGGSETERTVAASAEQPLPAPAQSRMLSESYRSPTYPPNYDAPRPLCAKCGQGTGPAPSYFDGNTPAANPGVNYFADGYDGGPGDCGWCGDVGPGGCNTLLWAKFDVLLWWRQGRDFPPLVTTDPVSEASTTAGILPDAQILFGNGRVGSNMAAGGRIDLGAWTDPRQCWGYGWRLFGLGKDATEFSANSLDHPVLAMPFFNTNTSANDALLVAFPGLRSGEIHIVGNSGILGNDVYGRFLLSRSCDSRLDFITGWNYTRVNDEVSIRSRSIVTETGGTDPLGTERTITDSFEARNHFNGGILGLIYERNCGCWTTNLLARMSLGNMQERMIINGSTRIAVPDQAPQTTSGGLFTGTGNIGTFTRNEFTAITEVGFNLSYHWGPCTRLNLGYTFMYWNDMLSASKAIDTNVDPVDHTAPVFAFRHSDFWVQGLNLGLIREF